LSSIRAKFLEKTKGKGTLDLTAFCALAGMGQKMGKKVFDLFDMDGDGLIDDYEFICGLALFTKTNVKQRMEAIFEIFDVNRSQTIDKEEFTDLVAGLMRLNSSTDLEPTALEKKKSDLKTSYFLESDYVTKDQFASMATADEDLRKSLINIGIISNQELGTGDHDADLDEELKKFVENEKIVGKIDNITNAVEPLDDTGFAVENVGEGDQFMAVKPYLGVVRNSVPSNFKRDPKDSEAPNASLELHYVHGYRCHDTRNNIFYNPDGNLVYHTGLMGIQLNTRENTQRFVDDNTNDIMCMDTWNELSATGDIGNKPTLVLWNNTTMETYCVYAGEMRKGIAMVAFSADGQKLACGCMDSDNTIFILNVNELKVGNRASRQIC